MGPTKRARRAVGRANTEALVDGLRLYGPHVYGFVFFAVAGVAVSALAHFLLGVPLELGLPGAYLGLSAGIVLHLAQRRVDRTETREQR